MSHLLSPRRKAHKDRLFVFKTGSDLFSSRALRLCEINKQQVIDKADNVISHVQIGLPAEFIRLSAVSRSHRL
ncbi:MAG: hypothetical protein LJE83_07640 [Gammaproteobacteria bacterium]|nr:hypothetical protein [Gammaproteobacteria bacterium]